MAFKFPYGAMQQLNLDWFIKQFQKLRADWATAEENIAGSLQDEIDRAEDALSDVFSARDTAVAAKNDAVQAKSDALQASANAAQYWQNAANSASNAAGSAGTALQAAEDAETAESNAAASNTQSGVNKFMAEAWAVGTMNGTPVGSGTIQYNNNAKYYAQQASGDAAQTALDRAAVAQDKDDTDTLKDNANAAALRAEGWADGTQNGTPVTSGSPYYENNAKYYKEAAEDVLDSIPPDYTELADEVTSQSEKIDEVKTAVDAELVLIETSRATANKYIRYDTGAEPASATSTTYTHTTKTNISKYDYLIFTQPTGSNASSMVGCAFYDENDAYINGYQINVDASYVGYRFILVRVPATAVYFRASMYIDTVTYGSFVLYGLNKIINGSQWQNMTWFAYGTSITNQGKYTAPLQAMSKMTLTNKGIGGAGIVTDPDVRDAVLDLTDGKKTADLITLEVGANDKTANFGTISDNDNTTFCGTLNGMLESLLENTNAQIVVFSSPMSIQYNSEPCPPTYVYPNGKTYYEMCQLIEEVCKMNGVYYIDLARCGYGYYRINNSKYTSDNIHPTNAGGENIANIIWSKLKNIPTWTSNMKQNNV